MKKSYALIVCLLWSQISFSQNIDFVGKYRQDTCRIGPKSGCSTLWFIIKSNGKYISKWNRGLSIRTIKEGHWLPWRGKSKGIWVIKDDELILTQKKYPTNTKVSCKIKNEILILMYIPIIGKSRVDTYYKTK